MSRVGETGVGETGIGETGVGEMGVGETGPNRTNTLIDQSLFVLIGPIMTNFLDQITGFITHLNCLSQTVKYFNSLINSYIIEL